jgi:hypothetical protein
MTPFNAVGYGVKHYLHYSENNSCNAHINAYCDGMNQETEIRSLVSRAALLGLNIGQLCVACGVKPNTFSGWRSKKNRRAMSIDQLENFQNTLAKLEGIEQ